MAKKLKTINPKLLNIVSLITPIIILLIIINIFSNKDYEITYKIEDYQIREQYTDNDNYYSLTINKGNNNYNFIIEGKENYKKKSINSILEFQTDSETCIILKAKNKNFNPLCYKEEQISFHIVSKEMKEMINYREPESSHIEKYHNMNIYAPLNNDIYIWNYRGFERLKEKKEIKIFNKDIYSPSLITQVNSTLWIPNYESEYYFNSVLLLDMNSEKIENWILPETIYFDSAILGVYDDKIYIIDKHEQKEWEINIAKKEMNRVEEMTYQRGWESTTMNKLLYQSLTFYGVNRKEFITIDGYLYEETEGNKKRLTDEKIDLIARKYSNSVYYFIKNKLYYYDDEHGSKPLVENFEWNFNKDNIIFAN